MKRAEIDAMFDRLAAERPNPTSELNYTSPFELLVAVILSAQATDKSVNIATDRLYPQHNTPEKLVTLGEAGLLQAIRNIGLAPTKAKNVIATCKLLLERHQGEVPRSREALEALPGVGRKTANVVLNTAFGEPTLAVDTHVFRLANRTGLAPGKTVRAVEDKLMRVVPKRHMQYAHHHLILHGRYVCMARKPNCGNCIIFDQCGYKAKHLTPNILPGPGAKKPRSAGSPQSASNGTPDRKSSSHPEGKSVRKGPPVKKRVAGVKPSPAQKTS